MPRPPRDERTAPRDPRSKQRDEPDDDYAQARLSGLPDGFRFIARYIGEPQGGQTQLFDGAGRVFSVVPRLRGKLEPGDQVILINKTGDG